MRDCLLPHPLVSLTFLVVFAFLLLQAPPVLQDPDVAWHLAAGDLIRDTLTIPDTDPFSFTAGDTPWYNVSWAFDVVISTVVDVAGLEGLRVFTITMVAATMALLMFSLIKRECCTRIELCVIMAIVAFSLWPVAITARPQLMSFFFVVLLHHVLHRAMLAKSGVLLYVVPAITVVWANCHGGFLAVFVLLAAYMLQALKCNQTRMLQHLVVVSVLAGMASFVTPYHIHIIDAVMRTLDSAITGYIQEWQPLQIQRTIGFAILFFSFVLLSNYYDKSVPLADKILPTIWLVFAVEAMRNMYLFALVAAPFMACGFHRYHQEQEPKDRSIVSPDVEKRLRWQAVTVALFVWGIAWVPAVQQMVSFKPLVASKSTVPTALFDWLEAQYPNTHFYHDYQLGGPLLYHSRIRPFVDGRAGTAYPESVLKDVIALSRAAENWQEILDRYDVQGLIVSDHSPFSRLYDAGVFHNQLSQPYAASGYRVLLRK